jgi:hypothetical protein
VAQSGRVGQVTLPKKSLEKKWKTHLNKKSAAIPKPKTPNSKKFPKKNLKK